MDLLHLGRRQSKRKVKTGLANLSIFDISGWMILCCFVHCKIFSSISGPTHYMPIEFSPNCDNRNVFRRYQKFWRWRGEAKITPSPVENTGLKDHSRGFRGQARSGHVPFTQILLTRPQHMATLNWEWARKCNPVMHPGEEEIRVEPCGICLRSIHLRKHTKSFREICRDLHSILDILETKIYH